MIYVVHYIELTDLLKVHYQFFGKDLEIVLDGIVSMSDLFDPELTITIVETTIREYLNDED